MNANRFNVVVWFITPHFFEDERGSNRLAVALEQTMQKLEFQVGESYRMIEPDPRKPRFIKTVYGAGYCLELPTGSQLDGLQDVLAQARQDREQKTEAVNRATA